MNDINNLKALVTRAEFVEQEIKQELNKYEKIAQQFKEIQDKNTALLQIDEKGLAELFKEAIEKRFATVDKYTDLSTTALSASLKQMMDTASIIHSGAEEIQKSESNLKKKLNSLHAWIKFKPVIVAMVASFILGAIAAAYPVWMAMYEIHQIKIEIQKRAAEMRR